jgi:hypothetical protein
MKKLSADRLTQLRSQGSKVVNTLEKAPAAAPKPKTIEQQIAEAIAKVTDQHKKDMAAMIESVKGITIAAPAVTVTNMPAPIDKDIHICNIKKNGDEIESLDMKVRSTRVH